MADNNGIFIPTEVATSYINMQKEVAMALLRTVEAVASKIAESQKELQDARLAHEASVLKQKADLLKLNRLEESGTLRPPPKGAGRGKIPTCHSSLATIHLPPATPASQQE